MFKRLWNSSEISQLYPLFFTIVFVLILIQYPFVSLESFFYDLRLKLDFGISQQNNIVLITLDEESDQFLGETYPYTYSTHVRFLDKLLKDKPLILNYFIGLTEPEHTVDKEAQQEFKNIISEFSLTKGYFRFGTDMDAWGEIAPPKNLRKLGFSLALINVDNNIFAKDDVSRRAILNASGESSLHLWTANTFRKAKGLSSMDPSKFLGSYYVKEADATFTLFRYYTSPIVSNGEIPRIPFHRVVVGNFPKGFFTDKIVLVGGQYISNSTDFVLTPFSENQYSTPKLFLHAAIIQALALNKTVFQIPRVVSDILAIVVAIVLSIIISKVKPTRGLMIAVCFIIGLTLLSYLLFCFFGLWLYLTHLILSVFIVYYIWVPFQAIAEYQRRYKFEQEARLLKKVDNLKQNFISLMSHDLKTPVAKIAGITDVLINQYQNGPEQAQHLKSIVNSTMELDQFISSILDLTKIESSNLKLQKTSKDINNIINSIVGSLRFQANTKNIAIETELSPLYPIHIDIVLMKRVISNLVENAIKYSGPGSVVKVSSRDDEKWVYIEIEDNGVGIPQNDLENIFDKFYRVKNDASHKIKGSGLGLYLVKYFVELHGGQISASSQVGQGTKFSIKLVNK